MAPVDRVLWSAVALLPCLAAFTVTRAPWPDAVGLHRPNPLPPGSYTGRRRLIAVEAKKHRKSSRAPMDAAVAVSNDTVATMAVPKRVGGNSARRRRRMPESGDPTEPLLGLGNGVSIASEAYKTGRSSLGSVSTILEECMVKKSVNYFNNLEQCPVLVLNADFQPLSYIPLSIWSWQDAIKAVFAERVVVVANYELEVRSASVAVQVPSVIALKQYVPQARATPTFTRRNVFLRDSYCCQYCGTCAQTQHLTFDHVLPRSKGGDTSWNNVVTACHRCNNKKKDMMPQQLHHLGLSLLREPRVPSHYELQAAARKFPPKVMHHTWRDYLAWDESASKKRGEETGTTRQE